MSCIYNFILLWLHKPAKRANLESKTIYKHSFQNWSPQYIFYHVASIQSTTHHDIYILLHGSWRGMYHGCHKIQSRSFLYTTVRKPLLPYQPFHILYISFKEYRTVELWSDFIPFLYLKIHKLSQLVFFLFINSYVISTICFCHTFFMCHWLFYRNC